MRRTEQVCAYLETGQAERLRKLQERTRVPMAVYFREGIEWVLKREERRERAVTPKVSAL